MERHAIQESVGGNYEHGSMFVCVLMAAISFDGTLPVCSCAYVNICGWKGALLKSFFCLNVWAGFCMCLSVYWRICQKHLRVTEEGGKAKWRLEDTGAFFTPRCQRCLLYICLFSVTTWSHFTCADCNVLVVSSHLNLWFPSVVNSSFLLLHYFCHRCCKCANSCI